MGSEMCIRDRYKLVQAGTYGTVGTYVGTSTKYHHDYCGSPSYIELPQSLIVCCASDTRAITFDYGGGLIYYHRNRRRDLELRLPKTKRRNLAVPYYSIFLKLLS